jgi:hypothetical protein
VASASTDRPELAGVHLDARGRSGATEPRRHVPPAGDGPGARLDAGDGPELADAPLDASVAELLRLGLRVGRVPSRTSDVIAYAEE